MFADVCDSKADINSKNTIDLLIDIEVKLDDYIKDLKQIEDFNEKEINRLEKERKTENKTIIQKEN